MERSPLFDYVRLAGALLVLVGHAYVLLGRDAPALAGSPIHHLGVILFFLVSGYLIAGSWEADPTSGHTPRSAYGASCQRCSSWSG